ncbi:MAG: transcriptional repressor [Firmicutes bacterium]|nr:transcriptional repressor [Bacillota bacterium]
MTGYKTEQKKELISFLRKNSHRAFTIDEMCQAMNDDPTLISPPGKSTVYRLIPKLLEDNTIKQFSSSTNRRVYQIVAGEGCSSHIHLKCTKCGKIIHTTAEVTTTLCQSIASSNDFCINTGETVLFGTCKDCL